MSEMESSPVEGKGQEMIPERGSPFEKGEPGDAATGYHASALTPEEVERWEEERAVDFAASGGGRASRAARELTPEEAGEIDSEAVDYNREQDEVKAPGVVGSILRAESLPEAEWIAGSGDDEEAIPEPPADFVEGGMRAGVEDALEEAGGEDALFSAASFREPGSLHHGPAQAASVPVEMQPADLDLLGELVSDAGLKALWLRTGDAQWKVTEQVDNLELARELLDLIQTAKNLIMAGRENYEEAERAVNEVEYRIALNERIEGWSQKEARRVLFYEIAWLVALSAGLILLPMANLVLALERGLMSAVIGGLGGVFGALYSLWRHVSEDQDYNPQYNMWYYTQPLMGLPIGGFIFLVMSTGIQFSTSGSAELNNPAIIYTLAGIAGFQQNVVYDLVRRILKLFRFGGEQASS